MAVLAGGTWAMPASAQEDGVYFDDPDSPGGKEYSIPHERSRRVNGAPGSGNPGSRDQTPRFGAGIEPEDDGSSAGTSAGGGDGSGGGSSGVAGDSDSGGQAGGDSGSGAADRNRSGAGSADRSGAGVGSVAYQSTSSSDEPELRLSALALGVLLVGGGLGLLLRRSRRGSTS